MSIVIGNLVNNAIKFTPDGGLISISNKVYSNKVEIFIRDNGVGMSKDQLSKIFKIEESSSTLGTNNEKGTGLGLAIVNKIINDHNGSIDFMSFDSGAKIKIRFSKQ